MPIGLKDIPPSSGKVLDAMERRNAMRLLDLHTIGEVAEYHEISVLDLAHQLGLISNGTPLRGPRPSSPKKGREALVPADVRAQLRRL